MSRRPVLPAVVAVLLAGALLTACDPPAPSTSPSASEAPAPSPSASPTSALTALPADAVLGVGAVVTEPGGASLQLVEVVHRSVAWDSAEGAPLAAAMTAGCAGAFDESVYAAQLWSFAVIDVSATALSGSWPASAPVTVHPTADFLALASEGAVAELPGAAAEAPHCDRTRGVVAAGAGRLIVGFAGDTDAVGAAGHFTRWANHRYGFSGSGFTMSACEKVVTELGASLGGGAEHWADAVDATTCTTGTGSAEDTDS